MSESAELNLIEIPREIAEKHILYNIGGKKVFFTPGGQTILQCATCLYVLAVYAKDKYPDGVRILKFDPHCNCKEGE